MAVHRAAGRLALLLALVAVGILWFVVGRTLANPQAAVSPVRASGVVWGGRVFSSRHPLRHWLHVHGVAYSVWSRRHPPAAETLRLAD
jgi:hypothetical protein